MMNSTAPSRRDLILALVVLCLHALAMAARADTVWYVAGTGGSTLKLQQVSVLGISGGEITFRNSQGTETSKPLASVQRIELADDATFNRAEEAYAAGNFAAAVDDYLKTLRTTTRDWQRDWTAGRLIEAARKAQRFDAAATAYVARIMRDPSLAADRPDLPSAKSAYLMAAANEVKTALGRGGVSDESRKALLGFLLDIHRARGDQKSVADVTAELEKLGIGSATHGAGGSDAAASSLARGALDGARRAMQAKQFEQAMSAVNAQRAAFIRPEDQADALFLLAEARHALAKSDGAGPAAAKDAALAYMRVVAHFKELPAAADRIPEALSRCADLLAAAGDREGAAKLYEQLASQYNDAPAAAKAAENARRLRQAGGTESN